MKHQIQDNKSIKYKFYNKPRFLFPWTIYTLQHTLQESMTNMPSVIIQLTTIFVAYYISAFHH